jgi:arylsulfatase A-like enzyme
MKRTAWLRAALAVAAALGFLTGASRPREEHPNFVVLFCDDLGYGDLGCYGSTAHKTPNLDRMAAEGMRFTSFYVGASVCSASRAALMTGLYPKRTGITGVLFPRSQNGLATSFPTLPSVLRKRGYATACVGKWHLGHKPEFLPMAHGFDRYFGIPYSNDMDLAPDLKLAAGVEPKGKGPPLMRGGEVIEAPADQDTLTKRYTEEAAKFIVESKDRPFLLYLPHAMPHVPLHASAEFRGGGGRASYAQVIAEIDWSVGVILKTIRDQGLAGKTLVFFCSDNGPWLAKKEAAGSAGPLRDGKFSVYEGGYREPAIFWGPGRVPEGKVCGEVAATIDILPTFAALAGAPVPPGLDGKDIRPLIAGEAGAKTPHAEYFYAKGAVRCGPWKIVRAKKAVELFNLEKDPGEKDDLAASMPDKAKELEVVLDRYVREGDK